MATVPSIVNSTSSWINGGSTLAVTVPAGTANGHLLLLFVATDNRGVITTPAGWTLVDAQVSTGSGNAVLYTFKRTAASEPASYSVSNSNPGQWSAAMVAISGHNGVGAFLSAYSTFGQTITAPAITTAADSMAFTAISLDNSITVFPDGETQVQYVSAATSGRVGVWVGSQSPTAAGTFGPKTATSGGFPSWSAINIEVLGAAGSIVTASATMAATGGVAASGSSAANAAGQFTANGSVAFGNGTVGGNQPQLVIPCDYRGLVIGASHVGLDAPIIHRGLSVATAWRSA